MWGRPDSAHANIGGPREPKRMLVASVVNSKLCKELTCLTNLQEIARAKEPIRKDERRRFVEKWQTRWHGDQSGRWTHRLIPELTTCLDRKHGQVGFYLAQALSGHGCFNAYLKRFKKRDDESCSYYGSLVDRAEHTLFFCAR